MSTVGRQQNLPVTPCQQCNTVDAECETRDDPEPKLSETLLSLCQRLRVSKPYPVPIWADSNVEENPAEHICQLWFYNCKYSVLQLVLNTFYLWYATTVVSLPQYFPHSGHHCQPSSNAVAAKIIIILTIKINLKNFGYIMNAGKKKLTSDSDHSSTQWHPQGPSKAPDLLFGCWFVLMWLMITLLENAKICIAKAQCLLTIKVTLCLKWTRSYDMKSEDKCVYFCSEWPHWRVRWNPCCHSLLSHPTDSPIALQHLCVFVYPCCLDHTMIHTKGDYSAYI